MLLQKEQQIETNKNSIKTCKKKRCQNPKTPKNMFNWAFLERQ